MVGSSAGWPHILLLFYLAQPSRSWRGQREPVDIGEGRRFFPFAFGSADHYIREETNDCTE
ncbi:hypothetical protein EKH55_0008 [Sinorhizobium alkalisoli]|nr:hypothetical protein EKH55_0008 [Sinorhizobium alkalisoli]